MFGKLLKSFLWGGAVLCVVALLTACNPSDDNYTVGGNVSGLSGTLVLQNNGADDLTVRDNGVFAFATDLADGTAYVVSVKTQPTGQECAVSNATGTITAAHVTDVSVSCADTNAGALVNPPSLDMELPDSLTGGAISAGALTRAVLGTQAASDGPNCDFQGSGDDDAFQNGYNMTRFLVGAVASWMCISDFLIEQIATLPFPTDGSILDISDPTDPTGPSGIRLTLNSATQTTMELFFDSATTGPGVYLSWNTVSGSTTGRLVLASGFLDDGSDPEAPNAMRMDFTVTSAERVADMFLSFPDTHPNLNGFRIQVTKDLSNPVDAPTFTALGRLDLSQQWDPGYEAQFPTDTPPSLLLYTVSDGNGNGAAIASFDGVGISFDLTSFLLGHLGFYKYTKDDTYVFDSLGVSVWVDKNITTATFENSPVGRNSNTANLDAIEGFLGLPTDYFTATCANDGDDCSTLLNLVFADGAYGAEANSGADPGDWRTTIINGITGTDYLPSICPNDALTCTYDDTDVFDQSFTPGS